MIAPLLAHQGAADESLSVVFLFAALWVGWAAWSRRRGSGFPRLPAWSVPALFAVAAGLVVAAAVVPRALFPPTPAGSAAGSATASVAPGPRPASSATLAFDEPADGEVIVGEMVEVVLALEGGRIVEGASADLAPDTGHVHLELDGRLVSMTYGLVQLVDLRDAAAGPHTLRAEYVAADHAPFDPRVTAAVTFETEARR